MRETDTSKAVGVFATMRTRLKKHRIKLRGWVCSVSRQKSRWPQQSSLHISLAAAAVNRCDVTATIWLYRPPRYLGLFAVSSSDLLRGLSHWVAPPHDETPRTLPPKMLKRYVPISCTTIKVNFWWPQDVHKHLLIPPTQSLVHLALIRHPLLVPRNGWRIWWRWQVKLSWLPGSWCLTRHRALTHYSGRVTQICVFNTVKLGTSASSP